jgi:hypothetical protein
LPAQVEIKTQRCVAGWHPDQRTGQVGPGRRLCWSTGHPPTQAGPGPFIYPLPAAVVPRMNKLLAEGDRDGVVEALFRSVEEISDEDMAALRSAPSIGT